MSLSKLGLPGSRCGIIIADEKVISAVSNMNGIISLAPGSVGPAIANEMIPRRSAAAVGRGDQTVLSATREADYCRLFAAIYRLNAV